MIAGVDKNFLWSATRDMTLAEHRRIQRPVWPCPQTSDENFLFCNKQILAQIGQFPVVQMHKKLLASSGLAPWYSDQGLWPWTPLGTLPHTPVIEVRAPGSPCGSSKFDPGSPSDDMHGLGAKPSKCRLVPPTVKHTGQESGDDFFLKFWSFLQSSSENNVCILQTASDSGGLCPQAPTGASALDVTGVLPSPDLGNSPSPPKCNFLSPPLWG